MLKANVKEAVVYGGKKVAHAWALGLTGSFLGLCRLRLADGHAMMDAHYRRARPVAGARIATTLRRAGAKQPIG